MEDDNEQSAIEDFLQVSNKTIQKPLMNLIRTYKPQFSRTEDSRRTSKEL